MTGRAERGRAMINTRPWPMRKKKVAEYNDGRSSGRLMVNLNEQRQRLKMRDEPLDPREERRETLRVI